MSSPACRAAALVAALLPTTAAAHRPPDGTAAAPVRVTGVFSSLAYNEGGGDLLGLEVFVVAGPGGYYATVQCAGGEPARPVVVPLRAAGARVAFELPPGLPECGTRFAGSVTARGLRGRFAGEGRDRWLPRKASYWQ